MNFHPPMRLARSEEFLALDCMQRHIFRPLWVRGEERRWATDRVATADDRLFWELEAIGVLVGPGARAAFELALAAFLRSGAMKRDVEDLVLPILSGDVAKEQPAAATLRKRRQRERERERAKGGGGSSGGGDRDGDDGEEPGRDMGRDIHPMSRGEVTRPGPDPERDGSRDPGRDPGRDAPRGAVPERGEEKTVLSSFLSGNSDPSEETQGSDTAREALDPSRPDVTRPVTLTEAEVFALIERADGRIGTHPLSLRPRLVARLAAEEVTREQLVVMVELARARKLYLLEERDGKPGRDVVDLALLVGSRDGEAKVLGSWVSAVHREIGRRQRAAALEAADRQARTGGRGAGIPGPVKIQAPPPLAQAAQGAGGPRVPYLAERRGAAPVQGELRMVPPTPEGAG